MTIEQLNDKSLYLINGYRKTNNSKENTIISTKIFTDGEIMSYKVDNYDANYYFLNNRMYSIDYIKREEIKVTNATYVLIYYLVKEERTINNKVEIVNVIKDKKLYVDNILDKESLKRTRDIIQNIEKNTISNEQKKKKVK